MNINKIKTNKYNPNVMGESELIKLKELIKREKDYPALLVNERTKGNYYLIDGHQRLRILKELGYKDIKVDIWHLKKEDELLLLATINKLHGKNIGFKKKQLFEELQKRFPKELIEKLTIEKKNFFDMIYKVIDRKKEILQEVILSKVVLIQRLTREEYKVVKDYINENFKGNEERAIYLIIYESINKTKI